MPWYLLMFNVTGSSLIWKRKNKDITNLLHVFVISGTKSGITESSMKDAKWICKIIVMITFSSKKKKAMPHWIHASQQWLPGLGIENSQCGFSAALNIFKMDPGYWLPIWYQRQFFVCYCSGLELYSFYVVYILTHKSYSHTYNYKYNILCI